mmetsp:Transcript_6117/g.11202  ORF Transcript_6117/g.11202 Transcript_6117/m.11202 type:complete len:541 (-) Transcript_6117:105-1727(-)
MEVSQGVDPAAIRRFRNRSIRGSTLEKLNQSRQTAPKGDGTENELEFLSARFDVLESLEKSIQNHLLGFEGRHRANLDNKVQEIPRLLEDIFEFLKSRPPELQTLGCSAEIKPPEISPRFAELPASPFPGLESAKEEDIVRDETQELQGVSSSFSACRTGTQSCESRFGRAEDSMDKVLSVSVGKKIYRRPFLKRVVWSCLEDGSSSRTAWYYGVVMDLFIIFSVLLSLFESSHIGEADVPLSPMSLLDLGFDLTFMIELCLRFVAWPTVSHFFCNVYNLIDLFVMPSLCIRFALGINTNPTADVTWSTLLLCFFPVLRLLKLLRRFETFQVLLSAWWAVFEALPMLIFVLAIIALTFASILFAVEPRSNIADWGSALWLTVVSMTGLGYGDLTPNTTEGKACVSLLIITSLLYLSIPFGILGSAFTLAWSQRDAVIAVRKLRKRLSNHGFTSEDMRKLLQHFDLDHDTEISLVELRTMINHVMIGFTDAEVSDLFESLDFEQRGLIRAASFLTIVFPREFEECKYTYVPALRKRHRIFY